MWNSDPALPLNAENVDDSLDGGGGRVGGCLVADGGAGRLGGIGARGVGWADELPENQVQLINQSITNPNAALPQVDDRAAIVPSLVRSNRHQAHMQLPNQ